MLNLQSLLERDPTHVRTLRVAALLGQGLVLEALSAAGTGAAEAQSTFRQLMSSLPENDPALTLREAEALMDVLDAALEAYGGRGAREAATLERALTAFERAGDDVQTVGFVGDAAKLAAALGLSMAMILGVAKVSGDVKVSQGTHLHIAAGVPDKLEPFIKVFSGVFGSLDEGGGKAQEDLPAPRQATQSERGHSPAPGKKHAPPAHGDKARRTHALTHSEALLRRDQVLGQIRDGTLLQSILKSNQPDSLFVRQGAKGLSDTWDVATPSDKLFRFGAGVFGAIVDGHPAYRVGLRIQSRKRLTNRAVTLARAELDAAFPDEISLRWTSPILCLASNPTGKIGSWSTSFGSRLAIGSPLNVAGGAFGALGLILAEGKDFFALTAGHVIHDDGRHPPESDVFSPPQPVECDTDHHVGTVESVATFPIFDPTESFPEQTGLDFALVRMDPSRVPLRGDRRKIGNRLHGSKVMDDQTIREQQPKRIIKSPAKNREAVGRYVQSDVRAEIMNAATGAMVLGDGLIEIELEERFAVGPGDSGALICVDSETSGLHPAAILIAAAKKASFSDGHSRTRTAIYGLPLSRLSALSGKEIL